MIKIEKHYKADAIFAENQDTTWDRMRDKSFKVSIFGITVYKRTENLSINYENISTKKLGFRDR